MPIVLFGKVGKHIMNQLADKGNDLSVSLMEVQNTKGQNADEIMKHMCVALYIHSHPFLGKNDSYRVRYLEKLCAMVAQHSPEDIFALAWLDNYRTPIFGKQWSGRSGLYYSDLGNKAKDIKKKVIINKNRRMTLDTYRYAFIIDCLFLCAFGNERKGQIVLKNLKTLFHENYYSRMDMLFSVLYHGKPFRGNMWGIADLIFNWRENVEFLQEKPLNILVTANMSAGKSTFINALVGKNISLSQNMACTSKIHSIVSKPYEDGYVYEYDYDLVTNAGREELLNDNEMNHSDWLSVGTYYNGMLGGCRLIIHDSPGVNFSEDEKHRKMTEDWIKRNNYELLVYVMDATQLRTTDEEAHLKFVRENAKECPMLFVMNKIDAFNIEEESVEEAIKVQRRYLEDIGFHNPLLCPVSSRAAYLAKKCTVGRMTKSETKELNNLIFKFEEMDLPQYYDKSFPEIQIPDGKREEMQLLKNSGMSYIEQIILKIYDGGRDNDTGLR